MDSLEQPGSDGVPQSGGRLGFMVVGAMPGARDGDRCIDGTLLIVIDGGPQLPLAVFDPDLGARGPLDGLIGQTFQGELWSHHPPRPADLGGAVVEYTDGGGIQAAVGEVIALDAQRMVLDVGFPLCVHPPARKPRVGDWFTVAGGVRLAAVVASGVRFSGRSADGSSEIGCDRSDERRDPIARRQQPGS